MTTKKKVAQLSALSNIVLLNFIYSKGVSHSVCLAVSAGFYDDPLGLLIQFPSCLLATTEKCHMGDMHSLVALLLKMVRVGFFKLFCQGSNRCTAESNAKSSKVTASSCKYYTISCASCR